MAFWCIALLSCLFFLKNLHQEVFSRKLLHKINPKSIHKNIVPILCTASIYFLFWLWCSFSTPFDLCRWTLSMFISSHLHFSFRFCDKVCLFRCVGINEWIIVLFRQPCGSPMGSVISWFYRAISDPQRGNKIVTSCFLIFQRWLA
jgi:hypothetical protein